MKALGNELYAQLHSVGTKKPKLGKRKWQKKVLKQISHTTFSQPWIMFFFVREGLRFPGSYKKLLCFRSLPLLEIRVASVYVSLFFITSFSRELRRVPGGTVMHDDPSANPSISVTLAPLLDPVVREVHGDVYNGVAVVYGYCGKK